MVKLIKRVKNGAFLYQTTLVPRAPRISRTLCRHATTSQRHYEHFQKLRDDWAIPAVTGLGTCQKLAVGEGEVENRGGSQFFKPFK